MANRPTADAGRFRKAPERSPEFAHLALDGLRTYRLALTKEEGRVSYWRRIIQAHLDLVRAAESGSAGVAERLRDVFTDARVDSGRRALMTVIPVEDIPPLPDLAELWTREPVPGTDEYNAQLAEDLARAEAELSAYRTALHRRLAAATGELIARYREEPSLCLSALPIAPAGIRAEIA
jgi:hypothetical protein